MYRCRNLHGIIVEDNHRYGIEVVSYLQVADYHIEAVVFDNDAMEGLNLPNNLKASAAKRMEQGCADGQRRDPDLG